MAEETMINGGIPDDRQVEISEENNAKISGLTQKVVELELENGRLVQENNGYKHQFGELKSSVKDLSDENVELKKKVDVLDSENKVLGAVAASVAELEGDVSKLQHDLVSATSDLQDTTAELTSLKKKMTEMKEMEKEKDVKSEALEKERNILLSKVENLEEVEITVRDTLDGKEREVQALKKNVEELEARLGNSKNLLNLKNDLEKTVENMKAEISVLENSLDEKEKVIIDFENSERTVMDHVDGSDKKDISAEVGKKGLVCEMNKKQWAVMAGSTFAAVAIVGAGYCIRQNSRKQ